MPRPDCRAFVVELVTLPHEPRYLELVDLKPALPGPGLTWRELLSEKVRSLMRRYGAFILVFALPMLLSAAYLLLFAADRYQSEARFVVRNPGMAQVNNSVNAILASGGAVRATDDAYGINAYLESMNALDALERVIDFRAIASLASRDPLWRYPRWFTRHSREALHDQYRRLVVVKYDKTTGISSLSVQAFTPQDAQAIAIALLENAESLANRLSARARADAVRESEADVERARLRAVAALDRLTEYRNRERVVDPTRISNAVVETIARLSLEIAQTNAQLMELQQAAGQSPQLQPLRLRIQALERQVVAERGQLAGTDTALAAKIAEFEVLMLEKDFSEKLMAAAINSAETARLEMARQQLYVERVVSPGLADYPEAPRRWLLLGIIAFICFLIHAAYSRLRQTQLEKQRSG